jgi:hypothetical protein
MEHQHPTNRGARSGRIGTTGASSGPEVINVWDAVDPPSGQAVRVDARVDLLIGMAPGVLGDTVAAVLAHELGESVVHRTSAGSAVGRYDAAVVHAGESLRAEVDVVVVLPDEGECVEVEIRRGDDRLMVPVGDDVVASLVHILRTELGRL